MAFHALGIAAVVVGPVLKANLISTTAGIPLTWAALLAVELLATSGAALGLDTPLPAFLAVRVRHPG